MDNLTTCAKCRIEKPQQDRGSHTCWCKSCYNAWKREWRRKNPDKVLGQTERAEQRSPGRHKRYERISYLRHRAERIAKARRWNVEHKDRFAERESRRRAVQREAIPTWADHNKIALIYSWARKLTKQSGESFVVDHIVPLQSRLVCGLHVEHNLQILPRLENISKGNRYWNDMP